MRRSLHGSGSRKAARWEEPRRVADSMKSPIDFLLKQPITIAVGTMLAIFSGLLAITRVPVRMTPEVSSVVIAVTTNWENASVEEIESDIIEEQEKVLGEVTGLKSMISTSAWS